MRARRFPILAAAPKHHGLHFEIKRVVWIKNVVVDLIVTVVILLLVVQDARWAEVAVWIYTALMVVLKGLALFAGRLGGLGQGREAAPAWFFHVIYAVNVGALAADGRWLLAGLWLLIWALSVAAGRRRKS